MQNKIPISINSTLQKLKNTFSECSDFIIRELYLDNEKKYKIIVAYIDGFIDKNIFNENIMEPILRNKEKNIKEENLFEFLQEKIISNGEIKVINDFKISIDMILSGDAILYVNGQEKALQIGVRAPYGRNVQEPETESVIRGSREGFVENLKINTVLLRKRIKDSNLKIEILTLGKRTQTDIAICYIKDLVKKEILEQVKERINKIEIDAVLESGYIENYIEDGKIKVFPVVGNSEKPDKVAGKLLEGRVAILCDGTPMVLTIPYLFVECLQSAEDYYDNTFFASFMRILRLLCLVISMVLPALYVAVSAFHQTIIPFNLMITMAASREGIPFPPFIEAMLMTITFEILREAGVRMPKAIGQAVSIVGAIVLGEAAVAAGIASAPMVIVTGLTAICTFVVVPMMRVVVLFRIIFLIFSNIFGLFGIVFIGAFTLIHLCNKKSFGIPYLTPFSPLIIEDLKDSLIVVPIWAMVTRPRLLTSKDQQRLKSKKIHKGNT